VTAVRLVHTHDGPRRDYIHQKEDGSYVASEFARDAKTDWPAVEEAYAVYAQARRDTGQHWEVMTTKALEAESRGQFALERHFGREHNGLI